jgi:hypothetical protein
LSNSAAHLSINGDAICLIDNCLPFKDLCPLYLQSGSALCATKRLGFFFVSAITFTDAEAVSCMTTNFLEQTRDAATNEVKSSGTNV